MLLTISITTNAQQYTVRKDATGQTMRHNNDSTMLLSVEERSHSLYKSGKFLKKSASYDAMSWGLTILSAVAYSGVISDKRSTSNIIGTVSGVGAIAARILSVAYKIKAGTELELSAGSVVLKF